MRSIMIKPVLNGWIVEVGCQTVVYVNAETLLSGLREYMQDAKGFEERFIASAVNKDLLENQAPTAPVAQNCEYQATEGTPLRTGLGIRRQP